MKQLNITFLLTMLMSMIGIQAFAHDIEVANADGVTIYYNYKNNSTELAVTYRGRPMTFAPAGWRRSGNTTGKPPVEPARNWP